MLGGAPMPTYDYLCRECGHEFEAFQSMSAEHLQECPECGRLALARLIGAGSLAIVRGAVAPCRPQLCPRRAAAKPKIKPWYRSKDKVDMNILRDPDRYIQTGEVGE